MAQAGIKSLRGLVLILFFLAVAVAAGAAPRGTINLSPSVRTGAATGGPFLVPNESYTASFVLGLRGIVNSDSFVCDDSLNP